MNKIICMLLILMCATPLFAWESISDNSCIDVRDNGVPIFDAMVYYEYIDLDLYVIAKITIDCNSDTVYMLDGIIVFGGKYTVIKQTDDIVPTLLYGINKKYICRNVKRV